MSGPCILVGAGDVGGSRAIIPILRELERKGCSFSILDHGFLTKESPSWWPRVSPAEGDLRAANWCRRNVRVYVFSTSAHDQIPLLMARNMKAAGVPVLCVLDNWMNYRKRLEIDGEGLILPDIYAVMDEFARDAAIADGISASLLRVCGHPALAGLADRYMAFPRREKRASFLREFALSQESARLVLFVSEPVALDQGSDAAAPQYRGYTESTVLSLFARSLQSWSSSVVVGLAPHPREDAAALLAQWNTCKGDLRGGGVTSSIGRESVFMADAVCGMASLLLLESMLLGKSTLSLQPGLKNSHFCFLREKGLRNFVTEERKAQDAVDAWIAGIPVDFGDRPFHPDLALHRRAPSALAELILQMGA